MTAFARALVATLGIAFLAFLISIVPQRLASAAPPAPPAPPPAPNVPSVPVSVVNTPLPVSQSGAWSVAVNNLPASQSVTFSGAQPVSFSNTLSAPLYNSDRDNPARQPVIGSCDISNQIPPSPGVPMLCTFTFSANNQSLFSTIPAGQRLVIETAAGGAEVPTGTIPLAYGLITVVGQASAGFSLVPQRVGANNGYDIFMASEQLRLYADPGSTVQLTFASSQNQQSINAGMSVAGYLVNLP